MIETPISDRLGPTIAFEKDVYPYHVALIEEGIREYFQSGGRSVAMLPFSFGDLDDLCLSHIIGQLVVIGWFQSEDALTCLEKKRVRFLNLQECPRMSNTGVDLRFEGEGRLAVDFFVKELALEHLAFIGYEHTVSSLRRHAEFSDQAAAYGLSVESCIEKAKVDMATTVTFYKRDVSSSKKRSAQLRELLSGIRKPAGIFCTNDALAFQATYYARQMGFSIPGEICILGVGGNHRAEVDGVHSMSIVLLDHLRQGYVAAELMEDYLINGRESRVRLKPNGILHRGTTIRRRIRDSLISKALVMVQQYDKMTIAALCKALNVSRRTLETRCRMATNMTIAKVIDYERFSRAKTLMGSFQQYNKESIASLAGYSSRDQMRRSFQRFARMSPSQYLNSRGGR